ncbi:MAG: DNA recombination protein RmuC [Planctomycetota bacterium]|nr:DNA recombination protein RmuC [Planctomycetota bacterium]
MYALIGLGIGLALGAGALALLLLPRRYRRLLELSNARTHAKLLGDQITDLLEEIKELRTDLDKASTQRDQAGGQIALLTQQVEALKEQQKEQVKVLEEASSAFTGAFQALSSDAPEEHRDELVALAKQHFKPIEELLATQETALSKIERRRERLYAQLGAQIKDIADSHRQLETQTGRLVTALRRPEVRGQWGEVQLQNIVELAGMTKHCDFNTQPPTEDPASRKRPDMTVRMPGGGVLVLDSKVALDHFINTIVEPDADRESELRQHVAAVERHVRELAERNYQDEYEKSPDFVLMFVRVEAALAAAYEVKPDLIERAMERHVIIVTPSTLFVTLQTIAYWWRQEDIADNARSIADTGRELYDRLATFVSHFEGIGKAIKGAGNAYDSAVGSLEKRILPSARSLKELHATTKPQIEPPRALRLETRPVTSTELTQQAEQ